MDNNSLFSVFGCNRNFAHVGYVFSQQEKLPNLGLRIGYPEPTHANWCNEYQLNRCCIHPCSTKEFLHTHALINLLVSYGRKKQTLLVSSNSNSNIDMLLSDGYLFASRICRCCSSDWFWFSKVLQLRCIIWLLCCLFWGCLLLGEL